MSRFSGMSCVIVKTIMNYTSLVIVLYYFKTIMNDMNLVVVAELFLVLGVYDLHLEYLFFVSGLTQKYQKCHVVSQITEPVIFFSHRALV